MAELTPRRRRILKAIVETYVASALPVSSELVARRFETGVSTATIRNEMAALEEAGLIYQPHTSAGRVPTDLGYRYYVEHLMEGVDVPPAEQRTIRHQFHQIEARIDEWVQLASSVLAQAVHSAAVVTPPGAKSAKLRRVEVVPIQDDVALIALLAHPGHFRQQVTRLQMSLARDDYIILSNKLSALFEGRDASQVLRAVSALSGVEHDIALVIGRMMQQIDQQSGAQIYFEGISHILEQPEFSQSEKVRPVVAALEQRSMLGPIVSDALSSSGVRVIIGHEHAVAAMQECAVVVTRYGAGEEFRGVLGVVGPTRLPYWRAVPVVRFMADLMGSLLQESYC